MSVCINSQNCSSFVPETAEGWKAESCDYMKYDESRARIQLKETFIMKRSPFNGNALSLKEEAFKTKAAIIATTLTY